MIAGNPVQALLIDIAGVISINGEAVPGAPEALKRLRDRKLPLRFVTNTTRKTQHDLVTRLQQQGFDLESNDVFSAPVAARNYLEQHQLHPHLLIHPDLMPQFDGMETNDPNAVVVGDAGDAFTYENMNLAFRVLMEHGTLIAMGDNKYFQDEQGLSLDMGPFVHALSYASGIEPVVVGKPAQTFFQQALDALGIEAEHALMVGDDLEGDVGGAQNAGLRGVLVRTGKYRPEDESDPQISPDAIVDHFPALVHRLLND
ncbi:MAG: TIGR01458 family HAD-type hydrolase [Planctomycetaceae bacterium]|nr:TIGR01458 family HAD-type hydrolase [Planctomycetaceae bacterium]